MIFLGFILVIVQCIIGTFGQYLNFPGLLPDGPLLGPGRGPLPPLQADVSISAGLPRGIFSSLFGDLQPFLPEPGCRGGCHGGQICRGNSCTCPTGLVFVRGLCGPKLVPLIQSVPGGHCGRGEECTGGSVCIDGSCCCPPELIHVDEVCIVPPPPPLPPALFPPPMWPSPFLPRPLLPSLSIPFGRSLLGIIKK